MNTEHMVLVIVGMTIVTALCRTLFFISKKPMRLPEWVGRALKYAPLAALTATIAPSLLLTVDGSGFVNSIYDPRIYAVLAAGAWYVCTRGMFGTIMAGMVVYVGLHVGLGW